jgi:hypothetical protein
LVSVFYILFRGERIPDSPDQTATKAERLEKAGDLTTAM